MIQLHGYWRSSSTYRVRIALEFKEIPYEVVPVSLIADGGEHLREFYRGLNPMAEVPTLVVDGAPIAQSVAILEWIEERYPEPSLLPEAPLERARVRQLVEAVNSGIHPLQNLKVKKHLMEKLGLDAVQVEAWNRHWITKGFEGIEQLLVKWSGQHAVGDQVTLADCVLVPQVYNARRYKVDLNQFPTLSAVNRAAEALPFFKAARPEVQPDAPTPS